MSLKLSHHNDGKTKHQSHEVKIFDIYDVNKDVLFSLDLSDIYGYGETKEEAVQDFKNKFEYYMRELKAFENILFDTDIITDDLIEVDCFIKAI